MESKDLTPLELLEQAEVEAQAGLTAMRNTDDVQEFTEIAKRTLTRIQQLMNRADRLKKTEGH